MACFLGNRRRWIDPIVSAGSVHQLKGWTNLRNGDKPQQPFAKGVKWIALVLRECNNRHTTDLISSFTAHLAFVYDPFPSATELRFMLRMGVRYRLCVDINKHTTGAGSSDAAISHQTECWQV